MTAFKIILICALIGFVIYQSVGLIKQIKNIKDNRNKNSQESNETSQPDDDNVINCEVLSEKEDSEEEE